jgi:hypothetical protein
MQSNKKIAKKPMQAPQTKKVTQEEKDHIAREYGLYGGGLEYKGVGNVDTRHGPSQAASQYPIGTIRKGMDGNNWAVNRRKNDNVLTWVRAKNTQI